MEIVTLSEHMQHYFQQLDWTYIITFILLSYGINSQPVKSKMVSFFSMRLRTRYRTALTGFFYGLGIYFIRGYRLEQVEILFNSLVFSMVFHKLLIERLVESVRKSLINQIKSNNQSTKTPMKGGENE